MNNSDTKFALTGKVILYGLPLLAIVGVTVPLIFGQSNLSLLAIYLAIPMFFAPIIYLKYYRSPYKPINRDGRLFPLLVTTYFLCFSISVLLLYLFEVRPFAYYAIFTVMATAILFEILLFNISEKKTVVILLQIMMLCLNIIWGVTIRYYYFFGHTDVFAHTWFINSLISYGHVTDLFGMYKPFPLWHILCYTIIEILDVSIPIHRIMFFTNGIIYSFMILVVYLVSLKIFKNKSIALLSSLFVSFNPTFIFYGMYSISRSVVSMLAVMLVLLLLDGNNIKKGSLAIILTLAILVYHTASIPFIILIVAVIYAVQKVYGIEKEMIFLTPTYLTLTVVMTLAYWIYYAEVLFETIIKLVSRPPPTGVLTKSIIYTPLNELFNYLQYSLLLFFVIIGVLWVQHSKKFSGLAKICCITGLLLVAVSFPGPGLLLNKLAANLHIARFGVYTFFIISIVGAVGFAEIYYRSCDKRLKIFIIILFIAMCFLSISNDFTASDNPLVKRPFYTFYFTEEEYIASNHVANISEGYLMSDYATCRYLRYSPYEFKYHILEIDKKNMMFLRNSSDDIILIREQELNKRPLKLYSSKTDKFELNPNWLAYFDYYYHDLRLWYTLERHNKLYDSGGVAGFN